MCGRVLAYLQTFTLITAGPPSAVSRTTVRFSFATVAPSASAPHSSDSSSKDKLGGSTTVTIATVCTLERLTARWDLLERISDCRSPVSFSGLEEGQYRFAVAPTWEDAAAGQEADDGIGLGVEDSRAEPGAVIDFRVDLTPPTVRITEAPRSLESASIVLLAFASADEVRVDGSYCEGPYDVMTRCKGYGFGFTDSDYYPAVSAFVALKVEMPTIFGTGVKCRYSYQLGSN